MLRVGGRGRICPPPIQSSVNLKYLSQTSVKLYMQGGVLKTSGPADFKSVHGLENQPRFQGVIKQNKIQQTFFHYCIQIVFMNLIFSEKYIQILQSALGRQISEINIVDPICTNLIKVEFQNRNIHNNIFLCLHLMHTIYFSASFV